jgi:hypothetical protein
VTQEAYQQYRVRGDVAEVWLVAISNG